MWTIREASDQAAITTQLDNQEIQTNMKKQLCRSDLRSNCKMRLGNQREGCGQDLRWHRVMDQELGCGTIIKLRDRVMMIQLLSWGFPK